MEFNEVQMQTEMDLGQAISYLEDIVAGLKSGRICVQHEGDELQLAPQRMVGIRIKARQKRDKESVSLKIGWHIPSPQRDGVPPLRISTTPAQVKTAAT
jgi:amphi-Trp domain-containing protein